MLYASKLATDSAFSAYMLKWQSMSALKCTKPGNLSAVTLFSGLEVLRLSRLPGTVHWFASLFLALPSMWLVYLLSWPAMADGEYR